jgi:lipid A 3-O-deacylase
MVALILSVSMNPVMAQGDTIRSRSLNKGVTVAWENDLYFQSDYYYTNGMQIEAFNDFLKGSPVNRILVSAEKEEDWEYFSGLQLRQAMYTPTDLSSDTILIGDHPYVSTLILSQYGVLLKPVKKVRIVSGLSLGVLGPASMRGKTQELTHMYTNPSHQPQAWAQQISNDFILNYDLKVEKAIYATPACLMGIKGRGRLGTLHTDMEAGLWYRVDARNGYFRRLGPSGDPGINLVAHISASIRHVFYDGTLQGGLINRTSPYVISSTEMLRWIGLLNASLTLEYKAHQLEFYSQVASKRFQLADSHAWLGISYKFWYR